MKKYTVSILLILVLNACAQTQAEKEEVYSQWVIDAQTNLLETADFELTDSVSNIYDNTLIGLAIFSNDVFLEKVTNEIYLENAVTALKSLYYYSRYSGNSEILESYYKDEDFDFENTEEALPAYLNMSIPYYLCLLGDDDYLQFLFDFENSKDVEILFKLEFLKSIADENPDLREEILSYVYEYYETFKVIDSDDFFIAYKMTELFAILGYSPPFEEDFYALYYYSDFTMKGDFINLAGKYFESTFDQNLYDFLMSEKNSAVDFITNNSTSTDFITDFGNNTMDIEKGIFNYFAVLIRNTSDLSEKKVLKSELKEFAQTAFFTVFERTAFLQAGDKEAIQKSFEDGESIDYAIYYISEYCLYEYIDELLEIVEVNLGFFSEKYNFSEESLKSVAPQTIYILDIIESLIENESQNVFKDIEKLESLGDFSYLGEYADAVQASISKTVLYLNAEYESGNISEERFWGL